MNAVKNGDLEPKKKKTHKSIFKISLSLALIVFVLTMSPASSFFQVIKPAMAASLTSVAVLPADNIVNTKTNYVVIFNTATSATIKSIEITFPVGFDLSAANRVIERTGIGFGSLSKVGNEKLLYTLSSAESVPAGTKIRFEIGGVVNSNTPCNCQVTIATLDAGNTIIDQKLSPAFPIKDITSGDIADNSITGDDVSPNFMIKKTLLDDAAGNSRGWDPTGETSSFQVGDPDVPDLNSTFISVTVDTSFPNSPFSTTLICPVLQVQEQFGFSFNCPGAPQEGSVLHYIIISLPEQLVTSSSLSSTTSSTSSATTSSTISSPFSLLGEH